MMMIMKYDVDYDDDDNENRVKKSFPCQPDRLVQQEVIPNYSLVLIMIQISHHPSYPNRSHLTLFA